MNQVSSFDENVQFTFEMEEVNKLAFLDAMVIRNTSNTMDPSIKNVRTKGRGKGQPKTGSCGQGGEGGQSNADVGIEKKKLFIWKYFRSNISLIFEYSVLGKIKFLLTNLLDEHLYV